MPTPVLDIRLKKAKNADTVSNQTPPAAGEMAPKAPQFDKKGWMNVFPFRLRKSAGILLPILVILIAFAVAFGAVKLPWTTSATEKVDPPAKEALAVELVAENPNSLLVPEDVRKSGHSQRQRRSNRRR